MASDRPKQYLALGDQMVIEVTIKRLAALSQIKAIVVGIAEGDHWWRQTGIEDNVRIRSCTGGAHRAATVLNGLHHLETERGAKPADQVLIHDAVRPCVNPVDIERLVAVCENEQDGGLLGCPLADTLKRVDDDARIQATPSREGLWRAMTPQLFALGALRDALESAQDAGVIVTDEAEAMERAGARPKMIESDPLNIKITRPSDLAMAARLLCIESVSH